MPSKAAKDQMLAEIERLRTENHHLAQRNCALDEQYDLMQRVVQSLRYGKQSDETIHRLKRGESHQSIVDWLGRPMLPSLRDVSPESEQQLNMAIGQYRQYWVESRDPCYWTNVTSDGILIEHLVALYLIWVHPSHMLFDDEQFMFGFRNCQDTYCSPPLVNAMCAMGCHVLRSEWRGDDDGGRGINYLQSKFIDEVEGLLMDSEASKMTNIQTWAIMFLVELSLGNGLKATAHLRLATESLMEKGGPNEQADASAQISFWGILTLTMSKSNVPVSPYARVFDDVPMDQVNQQPWSQRDASGDCNNDGYNLASAYEQAKLHRLAHEIALAYYGIRGKFAVELMIMIYDRLLSWRRELPMGVREPVTEDDTSHHLLFLQHGHSIQYHVTVIQALRPMLHLQDTSETSEQDIRDIILEHARTGFGFLQKYHEKHTCNRQSPLQLFCTVHICDALIKCNNEPPSDNDRLATEAIEFALGDLGEAQVGFPVAGILRASFAQAMLECKSLSLPDTVRRRLEETAPCAPHLIQNALTRSTYQQPMGQVLAMLDPSLQRDFAAVLRKRRESDEGGGDGGAGERLESMQIGSVLN
ncbi:MAG: hypothetical protein Q9197_005579 [Variospora fuerteventurae]